MTSLRPTASFFLLILALCGGCNFTQPLATATGSAQLIVSRPQTLSTTISRITVTVSASDFSPYSVDLTSANDSWGGILGNIPVGSNRSFSAQAFDSSGTVHFQGQVSGVTISANQTTAVAMTLQDLFPPTPYGNEAPLIDSLVASATTVQTGGTLTLTATAHDPNAGDTLAYAWSAATGTFSPSTTATSTWTAPTIAGIQMLTVTVTDSQGTAASASLAINVVSSTATGNATVTVAFNSWPTVSKVSASLSHLDMGQSTSVSALASDADGDTLSYQWTTPCAGTWTNATSSVASFSPSSIPAGACNNCLLTVTIRDGRNGHTTGAVNICVASSATERFPPRVSNFFQSATAASPGQTVTFDVTATDPQASPLGFAWTTTAGSLGTSTDSASESRITWTAPSCAPAGANPTIAVNISNAYGLMTTQTFSVTGLTACITGWTATVPMATARYNHTATVLQNGKVLVAGGSSTNMAAEVYDPATGTWSTTGPMAATHLLHTATLLQNGKVLVAGGAAGASYSVATAELYDPATGTWSTTSSMVNPRKGHTATLLRNGKVLVVGGYSGANLSAELYDPASGTWSTTGSMIAGRYLHTATLLQNGKVLVAGGGITSAELYDPASGIWSTTGSMAAARSNHTATLLKNSKVLVVGGNAISTELYDPVSGTWSTTGSSIVSRVYHTETLLQSGKVLVAGGYASSVGMTAELYDPVSGVWSTTNSMAMARYYHTATLLPNGQVLVTGGSSALTAELYTP